MHYCHFEGGSLCCERLSCVSEDDHQHPGLYLPDSSGISLHQLLKPKLCPGVAKCTLRPNGSCLRTTLSNKCKRPKDWTLKCNYIYKESKYSRIRNKEEGQKYSEMPNSLERLQKIQTGKKTNRGFDEFVLSNSIHRTGEGQKLEV